MNRLRHLFLFAVLTLGISCVQEKQDPHAGMNMKVKRVETPTAAEVMKDFLSMEGLEERVERFKTAVEVNVAAERYDQAIDIYRNVVVHYDTDDMITATTPFIIAKLKADPKSEHFVSALSSALVTQFANIPYTQQNLNVLPISDQLEKKEELINTPGFNRFSREDAMDYIAMSEAYMMVSPREPAAGANLLKAANLAKTIPGYAPKAVALYKWLLEKQPDHPKAGQAAFLTAFTLDNDMNKDEEAKKMYEAYLASYPDGVFAKDAKLLLQNLGKTDEELLERILSGQK